MSKIISLIERNLVCHILCSSRVQGSSSSNTLLRAPLHAYFSTLPVAPIQQHDIIRNNSLVPPSRLSSSSKINQLRRRNLFSEASLRINYLDSLRRGRIRMDEEAKERYIARLTKYLSSGDTGSLLKDDLINIIALAENEGHLDLIEKIAISIGSEDWGSAVMRLYYRMNKLNRAYKNIKAHKTFGCFFDQTASYQIVMTMLFNAGRYENVLEIYKLASERLKSTEYSSNRRLSIVAFAALAKINTLDALRRAEKLYSEDMPNPNMKTRVLEFLSYLALNLGKPALALDTLSYYTGNKRIVIRMIRIISLVKLKRYEDVLSILHESIRYNRTGQKAVLEEVWELMEANQEEIEDESVRLEFVDTLVELKERKLIDRTILDSLVFRKVDKKSKINDQYNQQHDDAQSIDRQIGYKSSKFNRYDSWDSQRMVEKRVHEAIHRDNQRRRNNNHEERDPTKDHSDNLNPLVDDFDEIDFESSKRFR